MQIINESFTIPNLGKHEYLDKLAEKAYENVRIDCECASFTFRPSKAL